MKKQRVHLLTIITGLILAGAIVCTHVFQIKIADSTHLVKSEKKEESSKKSESFLASAPTIIPSVSVNVQPNLVACLLFEIPQRDEQTETYNADTGFKPQKFLLALFRVIISPNAP
jgi:hypothetical protein